MKLINLPLYITFILTLNISFSKKQIPFLSNLDPELEEECKDISFTPTKENVKLIGRFYQNEDITWLVQSGSAIEFYAEGNAAEVILVGGSSIYNDENYRSRFGVYVDDEILLDSTMSELEFFKNMQNLINYYMEDRAKNRSINWIKD